MHGKGFLTGKGAAWGSNWTAILKNPLQMEKNALSRLFFPIDRIDEGKEFGDGDVDSRGNLFFDIEL